VLAVANRRHPHKYLIRFSWAVVAMELIMLLVHPHLLMLTSPPFPKHWTANWSRAIVLGTLLFAPLNSSLAQDTGASPSGKPNPLYQTRQFNGIMSARSTDPARLFVVEREEEGDQIT
jgi:hypothetical protein